jgi:2-keto-4-pentenoate hydratase
VPVPAADRNEDIMTDSATKAAAVLAAEVLMDEHARNVPFHRFAAEFGATDIEGAYAVQRDYVRLQSQARDVAAVGYKIGLTSKRMQDMCGIDRPIAGVVLADRVHASGATIKASAYGRVGVEFEIAVRLGTDLVAGGRALTPADVAGAIDAVCPAIEIIDDRHADYRSLDVLSLIADNSWNAGVVLGAFRRPWPDLATVEGIATVDGVSTDKGLGRDVLGHPFHAVAWLAGHLEEQGTRLRTGDVVMTGSIITTKLPERTTAYRFDVTGLGSVAVTVGF